MKTHALYLTTDAVTGTGGGQAVVRHEFAALQSLPAEVTVLGSQGRPPAYAGLDIPFLDDYFAAHAIDGAAPLPNLIHLYSGTWTMALRTVKVPFRSTLGGPVISYTVPFHNRRETIAEWELANGKDSYPFQHIKDPALWRLFSNGMREARKIIVPSNHSKQAILEDDVLGDDAAAFEKKIIVIPHGFDIPDRVQSFPESFRVGYLGSVGTDKGLRYLVAAWGKLNLADATLVLAGSGTEHLGPFILKHAGHGRFELLGRVPDVNAFMSSLSVYVQPSVTESFGIEILEAMGNGRPVLASDGAGASELLPEQRFVFAKRDVNALAARIEYLHTHPEDHEIIGLRCWEASRKYAWPHIEGRYQALWRKLLGRGA